MTVEDIDDETMEPDSAYRKGVSCSLAAAREGVSGGLTVTVHLLPYRADAVDNLNPQPACGEGGPGNDERVRKIAGIAFCEQEGGRSIGSEGLWSQTVVKLHVGSLGDDLNIRASHDAAMQVLLNRLRG